MNNWHVSKDEQGLILCFFIGCIIGTFVFICIWGTTPLNPLNFDWILSPYGTDFCFTEIGVLQYLKSEWTFPLGITDRLLYPTQTSIVFFDAVPIIAIFAKIIRVLYPHDFQYFGIWGFLCLTLQGGISALIIQKYCANLIISAISAFFLCLSPFLIGKMFGHPSMSGQFILLLPILYIKYRDAKWVIKNEIVLWTATSAISVGIIAYFTPMVFLLMGLYFAVCAEMSSIGNILKRYVITFALSVIACLFLLWIMGGIMPGNQIASLDYGLGAYNLDGLLDPGFASRTIKAFSHNSSGEAYSWLGLGIVVGGIYLAINSLVFSEQSFFVFLKTSFPYLIACFILIVFSASNKVMLGDQMLFEYHLPDKILHLFSIFRTCGRFIWPVWYLIVFYILGNIAALKTKLWRKIVLIVLLLLIQVFDGFNYSMVLKHINASDLDQGALKSRFWKKLESLQVKHVIFAPFGGRLPHEAWAYISAQAARQGATTNTFWLGRYPLNLILKNIDHKLTDLKSGLFSDGDLFVITSIASLNGVNFSNEIKAYQVDNQIIVAKTDLDKIDESVKIVKVKQSYLNEYLKRIFSLESKIIILSAREKDFPSEINSQTLQELNRLNIGQSLNHSTNFNYVGILMSSGELLFEKQSKENIALSSKNGSGFLAGNVPISNLDISVDQNYALYPRVLVDGFDCSHSYVGLNICVYDIISKKIEEVGVFDLYSMTNGVYLEY